MSTNNEAKHVIIGHKSRLVNEIKFYSETLKALYRQQKCVADDINAKLEKIRKIQQFISEKNDSINK